MAAAKNETTGISGLLSRPLRSGGGELLGTVEDLILDPSTGCVEYALLRARGGAWLRIAWRELRLESESGGLTLIPGGSAAKRLLLRGTRPDNPEPLH